MCLDPVWNKQKNDRDARTMSYDASINTHTHTHRVGSGHISPLTLVQFALIDLVIMLLFKYFGASLLGTSAVVLTLIPQTKVAEKEQNVSDECMIKLPSCMMKFQHERLDMGKPCQGFTDKVLQCAGAICNSSEDKAFASSKIENKVCALCQNTGFCTFSELAAGMEAQEEAFDREPNGLSSIPLRLSLLFKTVAVCGHCLVRLFLTMKH